MPSGNTAGQPRIRAPADDRQRDDPQRGEDPRHDRDEPDRVRDRTGMPRAVDVHTGQRRDRQTTHQDPVIGRDVAARAVVPGPPAG